MAAHAASPYPGSATRRATALTPSVWGVVPASLATTAGVVSGTMTEAAHARRPASPALAFSAVSLAVVP
eukprot:2129341-Pleurochrysis_carterae.AAC.1